MSSFSKNAWIRRGWNLDTITQFRPTKHHISVHHYTGSEQVSDSDKFHESYGLWEGKDATFCLAKMSMDKREINRTDWESLTDKELESLHSWTVYFNEKYLIRGRLKEYSSPSR